MNVEDYWKKVEECGWLDGLGDPERARLRRRIERHRGDEDDPFCLGLATDGFDLEYIEDDESYVEILRAYRDASNGRFDPEQVSSFLDERRRKGHVSFVLAGKRFEVTVPFESDYFEEKVHDLINRSLAETGVRERFFPLPSNSQIMSLVFVEPALYRRAEELGVIPRETREPPPPRVESPEEKAERLRFVDAALAMMGGDPEAAVAGARELAERFGLRASAADLEALSRRARERAGKTLVGFQEASANRKGTMGTLRNQARRHGHGSSAESPMTLAFAREMASSPDVPPGCDLDWAKKLMLSTEKQIEPEHCHEAGRVLEAVEWLRDAAAREHEVARRIWEARESAPYTPEAFASVVTLDLTRMAEICRKAAARGHVIVALGWVLE